MDVCIYVLNIFDDGNVFSIVIDCFLYGIYVVGIIVVYYLEVSVFIINIFGFKLLKIFNMYV